MSVAHSTDQTVVNRHAEFNQLAFVIDLDGKPLPGEQRFGHNFLGKVQGNNV